MGKDDGDMWATGLRNVFRYDQVMEVLRKGPTIGCVWKEILSLRIVRRRNR